MARVGDWLLLTSEFTRWNTSKNSDESASPTRQIPYFVMGIPAFRRAYLSYGANRLKAEPERKQGIRAREAEKIPILARLVSFPKPNFYTMSCQRIIEYLFHAH